MILFLPFILNSSNATVGVQANWKRKVSNVGVLVEEREILLKV